MKVILQNDVKDLGKAGDVVSVKEGYARNFLFPMRHALLATEGKVKEWEHLQKVAEAKKKKAQGERKTLAEKLQGVTVNFKVQAGEGDKIFGSVSTLDISRELEKQGFSVDRRDINLEDNIKVLGQHKANVDFGNSLTAEVTVAVEKA